MKAFNFNSSAPINVLTILANMPMVSEGGKKELRGECFDAAFNSNMRAKLSGSTETYNTAMMGGEPFAVWR
jgi:hypothetical protein